MSFWRGELLKVIADLKQRQPLNDTLSLIGGLTPAANKGIYFTSGTAAALFDLTAAGRALIDDADATAQRTTLGLGTAAVKNTGTSGNTIPLLDGANTWSAAQQVTTGSLTLGTTLGSSGLSVPGLVMGLRASLFSESIGISDGAGGTIAGFFYNKNTNRWSFRVSDFTTDDFHIGDLGALTLTGGGISGAGWLSRGSPVTKTADFTVATTESNLINNKSGSACTATLPSAASFPGREILFKTIRNTAGETLVSASSNVVPLAGGAAGTAILAATAGKWALLQSDGTNWVIMAAN